VLERQILQIIDLVLFAFYILLFVRVICSWLQLRRPPAILRSIERIAYVVTEPLLRPIRDLLMRYQSGSPIDFSPLILYLLLSVARRLIGRVILFL